MGIKLTELITQLTTWYARRDNPNQVTAAQADTYTKVEQDTEIAKMAPKGTLPIAYFGDCTDQRVAAIPVTFTGTTVTYPEVPIMLAGTDYLLPAGSVNLTALTPSWASKTGYLFISMTNGNPVWSYQAEAGSDSGTVLRVGQVTCDATKITAAALSKVFLLGHQRYMG